MPDAPLLRSLFYDDPTRSLEEVQKVNATEQALNDVEEFCETDSAQRVLRQLSRVIRQDAQLSGSRFLYLRATFGSGKTHLLKLIGYATGQAGVGEGVATELTQRFDGFRELRKAMDEASVDRFVPVFLNLLNRDATKEPAIPILIYEAIGQRLGYEIDPRWLMEFLFRLEQKAPSARLWEALRDHRVDGQALLDDLGTIRPWLYEAVPQVLKAAGIDSTRADVEAWIADAEEQMEPAHFGPAALRDRVIEVQQLLSERSGETTELLIGLDEIALFVGDERSRYDELRETMKVLLDGPNPTILGTGQWGLVEVHEDFVGPTKSNAWYSQEIKLEGADTETIVQTRWLQKDGDQKAQIRATLEPFLKAPSPITGESPRLADAVAAYPFRVSDLQHIREAMQSLLMRGRATATEHIQGRALLVIVRALFVEKGWADKRRLGELVPWSEIFETLRDQTVLIPTWVEELMSRLAPTAAGSDAPVLDVAQTVFLLNHVSGAPATKEVIAYLLVRSVDEGMEKRKEAIRNALAILEEKKYIRRDTAAEPAEYHLLTEKEVSLAEKIEGRAESVAYPQLRATLINWMQEFSSLLASEGVRREVDIDGHRGVPLTLFYSVFESVGGPSDQASTVALRVLANPGEMDTEVERWKTLNDRSNTLEDGLIIVDLPANLEERLRRFIATGEVLRRESGQFTELRADRAREKTELREQIRTAFQEAQVVDAQSGKILGTGSGGLRAFITGKVVKRKFVNRKAISSALVPIDNGPKLAAFFRGESVWPLPDEDASVLGVDVGARSLVKDEDAWPAEFMAAAGRMSSGKILTGEQVISMIEDPNGQFLGTPVEAMAALLLVLATAPVIQLRRDGTVIRDPKEMGRAVRTKTEIQRLTVRLEPPTNRDAIERLRTVHRQLTGERSTPDDAAEIVREIAAWAQEHMSEVQRVQLFVEREFDEVTVATLVARLREASVDSSKATVEEFSDREIQVQSEAFDRARQLAVGPLSDKWTEFIHLRREVRTASSSIMPPELPEATAGSTVPSSPRLEELIQIAKKAQTGSAVGEDDEPYDDDETGDGKGGDDSPSPPPPPPPGDEVSKRLTTLKERLDREANGRIVLVR